MKMSVNPSIKVIVMDYGEVENQKRFTPERWIRAIEHISLPFVIKKKKKSYEVTAVEESPIRTFKSQHPKIIL
jgi:hypothetical protein